MRYHLAGEFNVDLLSRMEAESIYVIREAFSRYSRIAMLWSMGKDSTALLWLCRKACFGKIPFPVVHIDTSYKFPEIYEFRDRLAKEWGLDLRVARNEEALAGGMGPTKIDKFSCCNALKTDGAQAGIAGLRLDALLLGIRRDEHGVRAKERYFSPRAQDFTWNVGASRPSCGTSTPRPTEASHDRIHPLLHMTELDIWRYIRREGLPVNPLYFANNGKRFRSIGCAPCCKPIDSERRDRGRDHRRARVDPRAGARRPRAGQGIRLHHAEAALAGLHVSPLATPRRREAGRPDRDGRPRGPRQVDADRPHPPRDVGAAGSPRWTGRWPATGRSSWTSSRRSASAR